MSDKQQVLEALEAIKPFVELFRFTDGRVPTERLSFNDWQELSRAYSKLAALSATPAPKFSDEEIQVAWEKVFNWTLRDYALEHFISLNDVREFSAILNGSKP